MAKTSRAAIVDAAAIEAVEALAWADLVAACPPAHDLMSFLLERMHHG